MRQPGSPLGVPAAATDVTGCALMFAEFARTASPRAPLYERMARGIAAEPGLAGLLLHAPLLQRQPVLLLACIHALLLDGHGDHPLASYYPNLTAEPDHGDPLPALREFCAERRAELVELLATRTTQTNEIGRCALLLPALTLVAAEVGPLAHLDVGASAGLNLLLDQYHYTYEPGGDVGGPSPVHLTCGTRGPVPVPTSFPPIAERHGLDQAPVDVRDVHQTRWLEACVWPDQTDRFARLRAALAIAAAADLDVQPGNAVTDTAPMVSAATAHPIVTNTWMLNYLSSDERRSYVAALDQCGRRRDLSWVFAESPVLVPELPVLDPRQTITALVLVRWRNGKRSARQLAGCHPHGYWLHWET